MTIRQCTPTDLTVLQQVARETFTETFAATNKAVDLERYLEEAFTLERLGAQMENPLMRYYLLWDGDRAAGYLKLNEGAAQTDLQEDSSLEIERIYVRKAFQGKGCGRLLMDHSISVARALGKDSIWLGVWQKNTNAIEFYEHNGFVRIGTHTFVLGNDPQTDWIMKKKLAG